MKDSQQPQAPLRQSLLEQPQSSDPPLQTAGPSSLHTAGASPSQQVLPLQLPTTRTSVAPPSRHDRCSASQDQDVPTGGHSTCPISSNANVAGFPRQIVNRLDRAQRGNVSQKRRGRSPRRRGLDELQLAVSSRLLKSIPVFLC